MRAKGTFDGHCYTNSGCFRFTRRSQILVWRQSQSSSYANHTDSCLSQSHRFSHVSVSSIPTLVTVTQTPTRQSQRFPHRSVTQTLTRQCLIDSHSSHSHPNSHTSQSQENYPSRNMCLILQALFIFTVISSVFQVPHPCT